MDVLEWTEKAESFNSKDFLSDVALLIIEDENAVDTQREQWSKEGVDYKGQVIGFYKPSTENLTQGRKKAGDYWNLYNSGDLWQKTFLNAIVKGKDLEFEFDSNGINKKALFETIKKHGEISNPDDIFGLFKTYQNPFVKIIQPKFVQQLNNHYHV